MQQRRQSLSSIGARTWCGPASKIGCRGRKPKEKVMKNTSTAHSVRTNSPTKRRQHKDYYTRATTTPLFPHPPSCNSQRCCSRFVCIGACKFDRPQEPWTWKGTWSVGLYRGLAQSDANLAVAMMLINIIVVRINIKLFNLPNLALFSVHIVHKVEKLHHHFKRARKSTAKHKCERPKQSACEIFRKKVPKILSSQDVVTFALAKGNNPRATLPCGVMVARRILVPPVRFEMRPVRRWKS